MNFCFERGALESLPQNFKMKSCASGSILRVRMKDTEALHARMCSHEVRGEAKSNVSEMRNDFSRIDALIVQAQKLQ